LSSPQQFLHENQKENNEIDENTLLNLLGRNCGTDNTGAGEVSMAESGNFLLCQGRMGVGFPSSAKAFHLGANCCAFTLTSRLENRTVGYSD
jgi:hypothetical protein